MTTPARLPDTASLETVLAGLDPTSADADLVPALTAAFPGFAFFVDPMPVRTEIPIHPKRDNDRSRADTCKLF